MKPLALLRSLALTLTVAGAVVAKSNAADPTLPPLVHLLANDPNAAEEGSDPAGFTVFRIGSTNGPLTVLYEVGGTASNGVDYQTLSGAVTIPAGAYTAPITVTPIDDFLVEGWESVVIALDQPAVWPPPYIVDWPGVAVAYVQDNDPAPTNRPPAVAIASPPDGAVFVGVESIPIVARASDANDRVATVEFFDGTNSLGIVTNRNWPATALADTGENSGFIGSADSPILSEPPETLPEPGDPILSISPIPVDLFRFLWQGPSPGSHVLSAVATDTLGASTRSAPVTIIVVEQPQPVVTVRATDPEATEPDPAGPRLDTATFKLHRTGPTNFPLTVWYRLTGTASNGLDYRELPSSVVIPEGARTAEVVIEPLADNAVEGDESVVLAILPPVCIAIFPPPLDCYLVGRPGVARAVIHDANVPPNRPPVVQIVRPLDGSVFLAPATISIVARAFDLDGVVVRVEFFEGTNSLGIVMNSTASLTNSRPPFTLVWSNVPPGHYVLTAVATDNSGATGRSRPVEIRVVTHPEPPVVNIVATDPIASEPGVLPVIEDARFEISRTGPTNRALMVFFSISGTASNGVDYRELPTAVMIPPGAASTQLVVSPLHDLLVEGTETVVIQLQEPPLASASPLPIDYYVIGPNNVARAVILDNDLPPTNRPPSVAIVRPENGEMFLAPADIAIYAAAFDPDGSVRSVEFFEGTNRLGVVSNNVAGGATGVGTAEQIFRFLWTNVPMGGYVLTARATDNRGAPTVSAPVHIRVILPSMPVVSIVATDPLAAEGPTPTAGTDPSGRVIFIGPAVSNVVDTATFTVRRSGGTNVDMTVFYQLTGTASNGVDYLALPGRVLIPTGAWSATITVVPFDDNLAEPTESVIATLQPVACPAIFPPPPGCYIVGDPDRAVAYIRDNDLNLSPRVEIVLPPDNSVFVAPADIPIDVLALDPDGWVDTVQFFADGALIGEQRMVFIVPPPPGQPQTFSMTWSNAPQGQHVLTARALDNRGAVAVSDPVHVLVVLNSRIPIVTIEATVPTTQEQDPRLMMPLRPAVFTVTRIGGDLARSLRVFYRVSGTASNGVDYQLLPGDVTIPANDRSAPIFVLVIDDPIVEGTETVILALEQLRCVTTNVPPPEGCYIVGLPARDVAYIHDNDTPPNQPPRVSLISPPNGALYTAPANLRLVAAAEDSDGWVSTVEFFANNLSLGTVTNRPWIVEPVRLPDLNGTILPGLSPVAIPIPPPFILNWSNVPAGRYTLTALATDNQGASTRSAPVGIEVLETNRSPVVSIMATDPVAREGTTNTATFRVRRVGPTNAALTVLYSIAGTASNGVDYVRIPQTVTIPAGRRSAKIVITPLNDNLPEHLETVILTLQPSPLDVWPPPYLVGQPATAAAVILDNDAPGPLTQRLPDGNLHLWLPRPSGLPFRLEASDDLLHWEAVLSGVTVTDNGVDFVEGERQRRLHRFYRVIPEVEIEGDEE